MHARTVAAFRQGLSEAGLRRGPERRDRIPLGGGPIRSAAGAGGRSGPPSGRRDRRAGGHAVGARGQGGDHDDPDRLRDRRRPGQARACRQPQPAGRQRHWRQHLRLPSLAAKRLELLHELVPAAATRSPCSSNPNNAACIEPMRETCRRRRARSGCRSDVFNASSEQRDRRGLRDACASSGLARSVVGTDPFFNSRREQLVDAGGAPCAAGDLSTGASSPQPAA